MEDEELYLIATNEVDNGQQEKALWAKSLALCKGNESKAKYKYIQFRVEKLLEMANANQPIIKPAHESASILNVNSLEGETPSDSSPEKTSCPKCYAFVPANRPRCTSCGKIIKKSNSSVDVDREDRVTESPSIEHDKGSSEEKISCSYCYAFVPANRPRCTSCGKINKNIKVPPDSSKNAKVYGGIGRTVFVVLSIAIIFAIGFISASSPALRAGLIPLFLSTLIFIPLCYFRMKNVGKNPWVSLLVLVPVVSAILFFIGAILPEGYQDSRVLDIPGKVVGGILLAGVVFLVAAAFIS